MADIFISYARSDRERAQALAEALEQEGYSVWWDPKIPPGKTFDEVIEEALGNAKCVVTLWSKESVKSEWVKEEASVAKRRKILIPALIEDVDLPLGFGLIQAADLTDWEKGHPHSDFDSMIEAIAAIVGRAPVEELGEGFKPEPSLPLTEPPTKPPTPKTEVPETEPIKPKPPEIKPDAPEPSKPDKIRGIVIAGAAIIFVLLLLVGGRWYYNSHQRKMEVRSEIDQLEQQISSLEKEVTIARTSQEKETLEREKDALSRQLEELKDGALAAGVAQQLDKLSRRLVLVGSQLVAIEPVKTGRLFVQTRPESAKVRILNIIRPYERGMELKPGRYRVEVTAKGYAEKEQWIELAVGEDKHVNIPLEKVTKMIVFVTSKIYNGNLGGLAGADLKCQAHADAAGLEGTFKAWMSDDTVSASKRLTHSSEPYVRTDGTQIAANWDDLTDGTIDVKLNYNEYGTVIDTGWPYVWTWTKSDGSPGTAAWNCEKWTSDSSRAKGEDGYIYETNYKWSMIRNNGCNEALMLYCFQQ